MHVIRKVATRNRECNPNQSINRTFEQRRKNGTRHFDLRHACLFVRSIDNNTATQGKTQKFRKKNILPRQIKSEIQISQTSDTVLGLTRLPDCCCCSRVRSRSKRASSIASCLLPSAEGRTVGACRDELAAVSHNPTGEQAPADRAQ